MGESGISRWHEDQLAAFLKRDGGGAGDQVVAEAVGDLGQRVAGAGDDHHAIVQKDPLASFEPTSL